MVDTVPSNEPLKLRAGDTWQWTRTITDHPASTWSLVYTLRRFGEDPITITGVANGDTFDITVTAAVTAPYKHGVWDWIARVALSAEVFTVDQGKLEILPNIELEQIADHRTYNQRALDALEAVMENKATSDHLQFTVSTTQGSHTIQKMTWEQILAAHATFTDRVNAELGLKAGVVYTRTAQA